MSTTSGSWQWPRSDISRLPSILGCLPTAPTDSAALKYNLLLLWHPTSSAGQFGMWEMPVEVLPWWSQSSISQNTAAARCKTKCIAAKHEAWKPVQNEAHLAGSGRRNLHLNKPGLIQNLLKSVEKFTGFKGEKPETPTWDFIGVSDWAHQTRELWFSGCPKTRVRD